MDSELINSIFITNSESKSEDMSGKLTVTCVLNTIPEKAVTEKLNNWITKYNTEWRWRFLEFGNKRTVEISYIKSNSDKRLYFNKFGEWVNRDVPSAYDEYVVKTFYYYN